ncbi:MAG: hypothetical protein HC915_14400 [Anaerolineae bacterium]|nr:hypothetical protein [Anaerolineae bacterium]
MEPAAAFPLQDITFTLDLDLTQEASGDLINPTLEDILPFGMQIVRWDNVQYLDEFGNPPLAPAVAPYLRVETVNISGVDRQRLVFFWDDAAPPSAPPAQPSYSCASFPCTIDTDITTFALEGISATPQTTSNALTLSPPNSGARTLRIIYGPGPRRHPRRG